MRPYIGLATDARSPPMWGPESSLDPGRELLPGSNVYRLHMPLAKVPGETWRRLQDLPRSLGHLGPDGVQERLAHTGSCDLVDQQQLGPPGEPGSSLSGSSIPRWLFHVKPRPGLTRPA